jgi:hypothetical protein
MIGGLEPEKYGAYDTAKEQDVAAKKIHATLSYEDNLFWLTIHDGKPFMGAYESGFFEEE